MDIEHCREFLLLASRLNFTEAASELNMTQPALSKHVHALEKEFGASFLDRSSRGIKLTEAGRIFSENAAAIVSRYERTKEAIASLETRPPLRLDGEFGDTDISSFAAMAALIARDEEGTRVVITNGPRDTYASRLLNGELDAFIGYLDPDEAAELGLATRPFMQNSLVAIVNAHHHLASKDSITLDDLRAETLLHCGSEAIDTSWQQIVRILQQHGVTPRIRYVPCDSIIACFTTPLEDSVLLWKSTYREVGQMLVTGNRASIPLEDDVHLVSYVAYRPDYEEQMAGFFRAVEKARAKLGERKQARESGLA